MTAPQPIPVLAIINTSADITELLTAVFRMEDFRVVAVYVPDLKGAHPDLGAFFRQHQPQVAVWDIAIPYEENWAFFQSVQHSEVGQACRFVLTTTNKAVLERLVGPTPAQELVGKPYDLDELVTAVRRALEAPPGSIVQTK